ncbi:hypothetical protein M405DRAFT_822233 [Rhizopogon salebrosus TDB-379]|nr:hypothetical protein M405DRAFT_822233 [Rhizopogon salebrosus TDB-379]
MVIEPRDATETTITDLNVIPENGGHEEAQDDLGVCGADNIQAILRRMNYKINFICLG